MNRRFLVTGLLTSIVNLVLHAVAFALVLKGIYRSFPAGSPEFVRQLQRPADELVVWAMVATSLTMGYLVTLAMQWAGARTFVAGLRQGAVFGFLFWGSVNSGLYAASRHFSLVAVLADFLSSSIIMMMAAAFAAWMLGKDQPRAGH